MDADKPMPRAMAKLYKYQNKIMSGGNTDHKEIYEEKIKQYITELQQMGVNTKKLIKS